MFAISTIVTLWEHMVVTTTSGGAYLAIEQTVPILELLIPKHMTVQETNPYITYFGDIDHSDPLGTHGRHDHFGGSLTDIEPSVPILELLIPEHMTVQETNPYPKYISCIDLCDPWGTHGRQDHLGGSTPIHRAKMANYGTPDPRTYDCSGGNPLTT